MKNIDYYDPDCLEKFEKMSKNKCQHQQKTVKQAKQMVRGTQKTQVHSKHAYKKQTAQEVF